MQDHRGKSGHAKRRAKKILSCFAHCFTRGATRTHANTQGRCSSHARTSHSHTGPSLIQARTLLAHARMPSSAKAFLINFLMKHTLRTHKHIWSQTHTHTAPHSLAHTHTHTTSTTDTQFLPPTHTASHSPSHAYKHTHCLPPPLTNTRTASPPPLTNTRMHAYPSLW